MASTAAEATPKSPQSQHTILLAQFTESRHSKHYSDHETLEMAIEAVCQLYETKLKQENPAKKKIVYDISDLFTYIDDLPDMAVLVYDADLVAYTPHNKDWLKKRIYDHLKEQASSAAAGQ